MSSNLKLKSDKTELTVVASKALLRKVGWLLNLPITRSPQPGCHPGLHPFILVTPNPSPNLPSTTSKISPDSGHHALTLWQRTSSMPSSLPVWTIQQCSKQAPVCTELSCQGSDSHSHSLYPVPETAVPGHGSAHNLLHQHSGF